MHSTFQIWDQATFCLTWTINSWLPEEEKSYLTLLVFVVYHFQNALKDTEME